MIGHAGPERGQANASIQTCASKENKMMIESEGITENLKSWCTDFIQIIIRELPREKVMFEGKHSFRGWSLCLSRSGY